MKTQDIANKLVKWCKEGNYDRCYRELYSNDIISLEPEWAQNPRSEGMAAINKKGKWWEENFEVHNLEVSEPIVAANWFTVRFKMDTTHRASGLRTTSQEIAVYQLEGGKIVKEQFFYDKD